MTKRSQPAYVELHAHSCFSLLDGTDFPAEMVRQAAALSLSGLALTDHNAVYGVIPFLQAARKQGVQPIIGAELTLEHGHHLTILVKNQVGWRNLCHLITIARSHAPKGQAALPIQELAKHRAGLIVLSGCGKGELASAVLSKQYQRAEQLARHYLNWFGRDHFYVELQHHLLPGDTRLVRELVMLADHVGLAYVATNNAHYPHRDKHKLHDVLTCIRHNLPVDASHHVRRPNSEYCLKSGREMTLLFEQYPLAIRNSLEIAEQCQLELHFGLQDLPVVSTPSGDDASQHLRAICEQALTAHPHRDAKRLTLLEHELGVIERSGLSNYFLIVADLVGFARHQNIRCQGRGSAANSLVAYLLGISPIDPVDHDLVFERFLSEERVSVPDIDIDIQANRREEVIQHVFGRYGADHTAMAATFITYRFRSAVRDVGQALGVPSTVLAEAALSLERGDTIPATSRYTSTLARLVNEIEGLPRHLGIHNGGMVIMGSPISDRLPKEPATMPNRVVVQWDKEMLEEAGIVKIDLLGLRMLSAIEDAVTTIQTATGFRPELDQLRFDDPALYTMIGSADTIGVFQVESRAQAQMLPRFRPQSFRDLIVSISLIRPGPIQGNMVHPYLRRRLGREPVVYPHPLLEAALEETLGVILYQEQVLKVARDLSGFSGGQGEVLRRALGGKHPARDVEKLHENFVRGATSRDVLPEIAEQVFESLKAFGGYSFPKSHAAAFAVLVYQSAWLKHYYPSHFYASLLGNQPMGFWTPAVIINDARRHGIGIIGVDINASRGHCTVEGLAIRIGFSYVKGFGEAAIERLLTARRERPFANLEDVVERTRLPQKLLEHLILVGAMDRWGIDRRRLLWELGKLKRFENRLGLSFSQEDIQFHPMTKLELLSSELSILGLSTGDHIMSLYRDWMQKRRVYDSLAIQTVKDGQRVRVAGETVMHQAPPTAKGFHFITLEDEGGMMNVIVRPRVYKAYRMILRHAPLLWVKGILVREGDVVNILCEEASALPSLSS